MNKCLINCLYCRHTKNNKLFQVFDIASFKNQDSSVLSFMQTFPSANNILSYHIDCLMSDDIYMNVRLLWEDKLNLVLCGKTDSQHEGVQLEMNISMSIYETTILKSYGGNFWLHTHQLLTWYAYLHIPTTGIQSTDMRIRNAIKMRAHSGHSCRSVMPLLATQAG